MTDVMLAITWMTAHLPLAMAFVLAGAALSKLVLAHDSSDSDPHWLWETYEARSEEEISDGLRWFYCAGLSVSLICMGKQAISLRTTSLTDTWKRHHFKMPCL